MSTWLAYEAQPVTNMTLAADIPYRSNESVRCERGSGQPLTVAVAIAGALWLCLTLGTSIASAFTGWALASTALAVVYCLYIRRGHITGLRLLDRDGQDLGAATQQRHGQEHGGQNVAHPPVNLPIQSRIGCGDFWPANAGSSLPTSE